VGLASKPDAMVAIDRLRLPSEEQARMEMVHDYFPDHTIEVNDTPTHCQLRLQRSNYGYCEEMGDGLRWLGVAPDDVRDFYVSGTQSFLCLLESWIAYGWSQFLAENSYCPSRLTLIHFDDHTDMMSPKIGLYGADWKDMLTNGVVALSDPETIRRSVLSGAITLGSMMTPLLHQLDIVDVHHVAYGRRRLLRSLDRTTQPDDLLDPGRQRMAIALSCSSVSSGRYIRTPEIGDTIKYIQPGTDVFLHIDMDYFNNRYNGSSEWRDQATRHDQPLARQKQAMQRICDQLVAADLVGRIRHVSVGISPSFYPSEFWQEATTFLLRGLVSSGLPATDLLEYVTDSRRHEA